MDLVVFRQINIFYTILKEQISCNYFRKKLLIFIVTYFLFLNSLFIFSIATFAHISVLGSLTHEHKLQLGGEANKGVIILKNLKDTQVTVRIYQQDYIFYADGTSIYKNPDSLKRSNAKWINLSTGEINISAKGYAYINYSIQAPLVGNYLGTYWSVIIIEPIVKEKISHNYKDEIQVQQIMRYAVQIVCHVGAGATRSIEILERQLIKKEAGNYFLQVDLKNTGEYLLRPKLWLELYDQQGSKFSKSSLNKGRLYPQTSLRRTLNIGEIPSGDYQLLLVIDNGDQYIWGAQYDLKL